MIEVLVGHIASGKSTHSHSRAAEGWVILNDDDIVNMVHGGRYDLYTEGWKPLYKSIEDHILHTAVAMGKNLVVDRGVNVSIASRVRWIALAHSLDVPVRAVLFQVFPPEIHAQRRFSSDSRGHDLSYWQWVAQAHADRYQPPTVAEGFCEIIEREWQDGH